MRSLFPNRDHSFDAAHNELLVASPVGNHLLDRDDLDAVLIGKRFEIGHARHSAVCLHELSDHPGRVEPSQYRWIENLSNRRGPIVGGSPGSHVVLGIDADAEGGSEATGVALNHGPDAQFVQSPGHDRHAYQPGSVARHEADVLGRDELGSDHEIAFVFAVFVVDDDHELSGLEVSDRLRNGSQAHSDNEYYRRRFRATYRAITSASR